VGSCAQKGRATSTAESMGESSPKLAPVRLQLAIATHTSVQQETPLYWQIKTDIFLGNCVEL